METHKKCCFNLKCMWWALYMCGYVSERGQHLVSSTMTQSLISSHEQCFTASLLTHFSTHFTTTLFVTHCCLLLLSPLSVSISEFNKQKSSFTKKRDFQTSRCVSSNHSLLSYCALEVDNLWTSLWGICISFLFFWSIFLLQRHGTLMLLKSHYYGITWLQTAISSALRCVRRGDKVWNPWWACAEWIEKRRQDKKREIERSEGFRLSAMLWRILCPGCWVYCV